MTKWMTLDQKFIWPSYIDKNDNKLLFDSYSEAWLNTGVLLFYYYYYYYYYWNFTDHVKVDFFSVSSSSSSSLLLIIVKYLGHFMAAL